MRRAGHARRRMRRRVRRRHHRCGEEQGLRHVCLRRVAGVGDGAGRARGVPASHRRQCRRACRLPAPRFRHVVHVPLSRPIRRMPMSSTHYPLAVALGEALQRQRLRVVTAESCTGGLVAGAITDVPGSSGWFERGFVTYTNEAKVELLSVLSATLDAYGAVSEATALEMAW